MENESELMRLTRWVSTLQEVTQEYPGRTIENVIVNLQSRLGCIQKRGGAA